MIRKFIFRNKLFTFAFFIFIASVLFSSCQKTQSTRTEVALGTFCTISLFENASDKLYDRIFEKINQIEKLMSTSIPNSEISKINQNAGNHPVKISSDTFTVLSCAKEIAILTEEINSAGFGGMCPQLIKYKFGISSSELLNSSLKFSNGAIKLQLTNYNALFLKTLYMIFYLISMEAWKIMSKCSIIKRRLFSIYYSKNSTSQNNIRILCYKEIDNPYNI